MHVIFITVIFLHAVTVLSEVCIANEAFKSDLKNNYKDSVMKKAYAALALSLITDEAQVRSSLSVRLVGIWIGEAFRSNPYDREKCSMNMKDSQITLNNKVFNKTTFKEQLNTLARNEVGKGTLSERNEYRARKDEIVDEAVNLFYNNLVKMNEQVSERENHKEVCGAIPAKSLDSEFLLGCMFIDDQFQECEHQQFALFEKKPYYFCNYEGSCNKNLNSSELIDDCKLFSDGRELKFDINEDQRQT